MQLYSTISSSLLEIAVNMRLRLVYERVKIAWFSPLPASFCLEYQFIFWTPVRNDLILKLGFGAGYRYIVGRWYEEK